MLIYLADLGHNKVTVTSDVYPLGVANLAAYAEAHIAGNGSLQFEIFREPEDLMAALDRRGPDVLGLSSYSWNHYLALAFARYAKAGNAQVLTLMGGPNFPLTPSEQEQWLRTMPEIDCAVRGPTYEGERAFLAILQRFVDAGGSVEGALEGPVPGNMWIDKKTGDFVAGAELERIRDLDEIPSPYLRGHMDKFFSTGYFAMMQIARGCPFTCQFCNSAVQSNSKAFRHSLENVKADLDYVVARVAPEVPLCFADDNFGMYREDEAIADYLGYLMEKHDWPKYIRTTTGKNQGERIIRVMRKAKGRLPMTSAVQSLNPDVLKNIKRSNISLDTYAQIQKEVERQGMQSYGELILSMPGETKASFMKAVDDLIETGVKRVSAHQLMLLHGAPLSNPDSRAQFQFSTRFRVVARCLGDYGTGDKVVETEEMVVETPTFSFQDYLDSRVFHLLLTIYFYEGNFEEAFAFAREVGIRPFQIVQRLQEMLPRAPAAFQKTIEAFLEESQAELFPTREACVAWADEHLEGLIDGSVGGNLLSKYSMIGRFLITKEAIDFLHDGIASLLPDSAQHAQQVEMLACISDYFRCIMLHVPFAETVASCPTWTTTFDVDAWRAAGYASSLARYRLPAATSFETHVEDRSKSIILSRIRTFGEHAAGLGRFTRTMFARDLRRSIRTP